MNKNKKLVEMLLMCDLIYTDYYRDYIEDFEMFMSSDLDLTRMVKLFLNDSEYRDDLSIIIRYLGRMTLKLNESYLKLDERKDIVKELEHSLKLCKKYINPIKVMDKIRGLSSELAYKAYKEKDIHNKIDVINIYYGYEIKVNDNTYNINGVRLKNGIGMKYRLICGDITLSKDIKTIIIKDDILSYYSSEIEAKDKEFDLKFVCIHPTIRKLVI